MSSFRYPTVAAVAAVVLLAGFGVVNAQTAQEHDAHHPENGVPTPTAPAMPASPPGGMDMGKIMGGNMEPMMRMMRGMGSGGEMRMMPFEHVEGRIAFLKSELGITEAQLPQWNVFADALRDSAKSMRATMVNVQGGMPAGLPARLDAMTAMMTARLDALKTTATATKALYAVLTGAQKNTADELVMSPMGGM